MTRIQKTATRATIGVLTALLASACVSFGPGDPGTTGDDDDDNGQQSTFTNQQAGQAAGAMKSGTEDFTAFYAMDPSQLSSGAFFGPGCTENITGDPSDPDGDGYPNDATIEYDCSIPSADLISRGTVSAQDKQPNVAAFAFLASVDTEESVQTEVSETVTANLDADQSGNTYSLVVTDAEVKVDASGVLALVAGDSDMTFTADSPWTPGDPFVEGDLDINGTWRVEAASAALVDADITTLETLRVDPTCESEIVDGKLAGSAHVVAGNTSVDEEFVLEWSGCDLVSATYNGNVVVIP